MITIIDWDERDLVGISKKLNRRIRSALEAGKSRIVTE